MVQTVESNPQSPSLSDRQMAQSQKNACSCSGPHGMRFAVFATAIFFGLVNQAFPLQFPSKGLAQPYWFSSTGISTLAVARDVESFCARLPLRWWMALGHSARHRL